MKITINKLVQNVYMWTVVVYIALRIIASSTLGMGNIVSFYNNIAIMLLLICLLANRKMTLKRLKSSLMITAVVALVCYRVSDMPFFISYLFILSFPSNLAAEKLSRYIFSTFMVISGCIVGLSLLGVIDDAMIYQHGTMRHSFGFTSPNAFASTMAVGLLAYIYYKYKNWKIKNTVATITLSVAIYYFTSSRLAFAISLLSTILVQLSRFEHLYRFRRVILGAAKFAVPTCGCLCIWAMKYFSINQNGLYSILNVVTTYRLSWMIKYYQEYGIQLLGKPIVTVSRSQAIAQGIQWSGVDNAYALFAIKYGLIFFVCFLGLYFFLGKKIEKEKDLPAAICIIMVSIIGITENYLCITGYNISLFFIAKMITELKNRIGKESVLNE